MAYEDPTDRQPKGDHNRRLSLGLEPEQFAAEAGIGVEELREYERTAPDHSFDVVVAKRVGETLDRLEAILPNSQTGRQHGAGGISPHHIGQRPDHVDEHVVVLGAGSPADQPLSQPIVPMTERGADGRPRESGEMEHRAHDAEIGDNPAPPATPSVLRSPD